MQGSWQEIAIVVAAFVGLPVAIFVAYVLSRLYRDSLIEEDHEE